MHTIIPSPAIRAWIYRVLVAAAAIGVGYGILTIEQSGLWLTLAATTLGLSNTLALAHTPRRGKHTA